MNSKTILGLTLAFVTAAAAQAQLTLQAQTGSSGASVSSSQSSQGIGAGTDVSSGFRIGSPASSFQEGAYMELTVRPRVAGQPLVFRLEEGASVQASLVSSGVASYSEQLEIVVRSPVQRTVTVDISADVRAAFRCGSSTSQLSVGGQTLTAPFAAAQVPGGQASQSWQIPLTVGPAGVRFATQGSGIFGGLSRCIPEYGVVAWRVSIPDPDGCTFEAYDAPCGAELGGTDTDFGAPGQVVLTVRDQTPSTYGVVFVGSQPAAWPTPWGCPLLVDFFGTIPIQVDPVTEIGRVQFSAQAFAGALQFQAGLVDFANVTVRFTNGLTITCP